jgi:chaperonin GroEL (HSP60 family)
MALNTGDKNAKITVLLITKSNDMIVDRLELQLKDGLLPIRELKQKWNAKV